MKSNSNTMSLRESLSAMRYRALAFNSMLPGSMDGAKEALDAALDAVTGKPGPNREKVAKLLDRQRAGDVEAGTELCALRTQQINLYVRAMSNWLMFFNDVPLADNEQACFVHTYNNPVNVRYIGQDGDARMVKAVKAQKQTFIDLREIASDEVTYPIRDINFGTDVNGAAKATVDIAWDLANKIDALAFDFLDPLFGAFTTSGTKLNRTYVANDRIITGNLPSTNILVLSDNTSSGAKSKFRLDVVKEIIRYCAKWANVMNGPIVPTGTIIVPAIDSTDLADEITPTSLVFQNQVAENLLQDFTQFMYLGRTWTLVPDVTIDHGVCYPVLSRKVADYYNKPGFAEEIVEVNRRKNLESRLEKRVINFASPEPWRVNLIKVIYDSDQE